MKVTLKKKILDPQGKAIESSLHNLGFSKLNGVRTGKNIEMSIDEVDLESAKHLVQSACRKLLANPVTEDYEYEIFDKSGSQVASGNASEQPSSSKAEPRPASTINGRVAESAG